MLHNFACILFIMHFSIEIGPILPYMYVVMDMCDVSLCIPVEAGETFFLKILKFSKNWENFVILKK